VTVGSRHQASRPGRERDRSEHPNQELESTRSSGGESFRKTNYCLLSNQEPDADPKRREMENTGMFNRVCRCLTARSESEFESILAAVEQQQIGAMVVTRTQCSRMKRNYGRISPSYGAYDGAYRDFKRGAA